MRSNYLPCRLAFYIMFLSIGWQVTAAGQPNDNALDAVSALERLQSDLSVQSGREPRWCEFLNVVELKRALESSQPSAELLNETIGKLQSVQHAPSRVQLQQLLDGLSRFSESPQDTDAISQRLRDFRQHLSTLGGRGAGWQQVLPLEELDRIVAAEDKTTPVWRSDLVTAMEIVEAEAHVQNRDSFEQLRRALLNVRSRDDEPLTDSLAQAVRAAKQQYQPASLEQVEAARRRLENSMVALDAFLSRGSRDNAERWKKFLSWTELQAIRDPAASPRLSRLARVFQKLQSGENGLQLPVFRQVTTDLERYLELLNSYDSQSSRLAAARQELVDAAQQLNQFLQTAPEKRVQAWKKFLGWDAMQQLLQDDSRDVRAFGQVLRKYESDAPGLELWQYRRVALRLAKYMELIALQQRAPAVDQFDARLEMLARALQGQANGPSVANLAPLVEHLNWLETTGRLPELRQQLQAKFAQPNFGLRISSQLVERALSNTASRITPVGMCFYGAWVTGTSKSNVGYTARLLPSADTAIVEIRVVGSSLSNTVARQRKVSVYAQGNTALWATKQLMYDGRQIDAAPACAQASTQQQICGAHVDRLVGQRLIGRFALKRANRLRPCAEQCSDCQARRMLSGQMDEQAVDMLRTANQRLRDLEQQLRDQRLYPDSLHVNSTPQAMLVQARLLSAGLLSAPGLPPAVPEPSDVLVQIHESLVNNVLADRMRGVKIDSQSIVDRMQEMGLAVPPELKGSAKTGENGKLTDDANIKLNAPANQQNPGGADEQGDDEPWSMQFDRTQPVAVAFRDGAIRITVRGFNFTRGDQQIDDTIEMTATYRFVYSPLNGLRVRRVGDVDIKFVGAGERLSTRQITYKTFLARRVGALFRQELSLDDLPPSEMRDRAKSIPPRLVYARGGWLSLGANVKDELLKELGIGT